eukprot:scaffold206_cov45-Phaeocystis_antarctica.AAC.2
MGWSDGRLRPRHDEPEPRRDRYQRHDRIGAALGHGQHHCQVGRQLARHTDHAGAPNHHALTLALALTLIQTLTLTLNLTLVLTLTLALTRTLALTLTQP